MLAALLGAALCTVSGCASDGPPAKLGSPEAPETTPVGPGTPPALQRPGSLCAWGENVYGQSKPPKGASVVAVAAGSKHSLALTADGHVVAWGWNQHGQCDAPTDKGYVAIAAGGHLSLALRRDGSICAWGADDYGQRQAPPEKEFTAIAAGGGHALALRPDGSIVAWGNNANGQCNVPKGGGFTAIAAGSEHCVALRSDGSLAAWGRNNCGQCDVAKGSDYVAVAAGGWQSAALTRDGRVVVWDQARSVPKPPEASPRPGEDVVQDATKTHRGSPTGRGFSAVSLGTEHGLALRADGTVVAWGRNAEGQCDIPTERRFSATSAGGYHSLGLRAIGSGKPKPKAVSAGVSHAQALRIAARAYRGRTGSPTWPTETDMITSPQPRHDHLAAARGRSPRLAGYL
jgi:alpha-tubulin suppressor-like RCC1 family protein